MKHVPTLATLIATLALAIGCTDDLAYYKTLPEIKPLPDKALCVIIRADLHSAPVVPIYCDTKYVGATNDRTMFTFAVDTGEHFVIARASSNSKVKFNFRANKIYFIRHVVVAMNPFLQMSTFIPMDGGNATKLIEAEKGDLSWVQKNPEDKEPHDMDAKEFEDIKAQYSKWAANPKTAPEAKKEAEYPGY